MACGLPPPDQAALSRSVTFTQEFSFRTTSFFAQRANSARLQLNLPRLSAPTRTL
jgi:hypothetical protein